MSSLRLGFAMTCYNDADVVGEAIADVLGQRYPHLHLQLIVVDNGSTDESATVISALAPMVALNRNYSHGLALNVGAHVLLGRGCEWIVVQNSDDRCTPDYAQAIADAATEHPKVNCIFSPWEDMRTGTIKTFPPYDPTQMIDQHQIPGIRAVRRDLWERTHGEDATIPAGSDWDWAVRASFVGLTPYQLDRPYVRIRPRPPGRKSLSESVDFPRLFAHMRRHTQGQWATWADHAA